ncbi:MAG TPA: class I SAM-dependent methyltransferase [Thermoplasmata archaeon]|nr:class I SAM-dependent methyltransferase [Thermoplasmata archaeon]
MLPRYRTKPVRGSGRGAAGAARRRRVREAFDALVRREWSRYSRSAWRVLARELRGRFLARHLPKGTGWVLELGPGPGRFTPAILATGARVVAVDLSRPMLDSLGRRAARWPWVSALRRVCGAGEHLPFRKGAFRAAVAYGNILGFSGRGGEQLLAELARVLRAGGWLLLDVASPVGAATEFLESAARQRFLLRILRDPAYYFLDGIVQSKQRGHQPYAPKRMGYFEFDFYTARGAEEILSANGFRLVDRMAIAPIGAYRDRLTTLARRDRVAWRNLIKLEERVGRRPGVLETGHGFVIAAVRRPSTWRPSSSRGRLKQSG